MCLLLAIHPALPPLHMSILAPEYTCHLRVTGVHTLIQPLEALALPVKEWPVIPAWPSGGLSCSYSRLVPKPRQQTAPGWLKAAGMTPSALDLCKLHAVLYVECKIRPWYARSSMDLTYIAHQSGYTRLNGPWYHLPALFLHRFQSVTLLASGRAIDSR